MQTIDIRTLKSWRDEGREFTLINVLAEEEFERVRIPGSHNIPVARDDFEREVEQLVGDRDADIVVYCASFDCEASPKAAKRLDEAGFTSVYDFEGGVKQWRQAGHDVERGEPAETTV